MFPIGAITPKPCPPAIRVGVSALKLESKDPGPTGKSDPFFEVRYRPDPNNPRDPNNTPQNLQKDILLYRSEVCMKTLSPKWNDFELDLEIVGGLDRPFTVSVFDWDKVIYIYLLLYNLYNL